MYDPSSPAKLNFDDFWHSVVLKEIPNAKIMYKNESKLMRCLGCIVSLYSPGFMSNMTTVIGNTIYLPTRDYLESNYVKCLKIVMHEFVHLCDRKRDKLFSLRYLFPQILAIGSLLMFLSFFSIWFMLSGLFLLFLIPGIPAPFRTQYELSGYAMNLYYSYRGTPPNERIEQEALGISNLFTGSCYYWMASDRKAVANMLVDRYEHFPESHPAFIEVKKWLKIK